MIQKRLKERLDQCFNDGVEKELWAADAAGSYTVEEPRQASHGDFATNMAMIIGGREKKNPREMPPGVRKSLRQMCNREDSRITRGNGCSWPRRSP